MRREIPRTVRVGEQIRRELAELLRDEVKDPRIGMVSLGDVEVSRDLSHARVYFSIYGDEDTIRECKAGLDSAAGFLKGELGRRMKLRVVPSLRFLHDDTQQRGDRVAELIDRALKDNTTDEAPGDKS
jgi:ribosome-binding factor A